MNYDTQAERTIEALRKMLSNDFATGNFKMYLSNHYAEWLDKFANTPDGMATELEQFASITEDSI